MVLFFDESLQSIRNLRKKHIKILNEAKREGIQGEPDGEHTEQLSEQRRVAGMGVNSDDYKLLGPAGGGGG